MSSMLIDIDVQFKPEPDKPLCRICLRYESQIQDNVSSIYDERNGHFIYEMINYIANVDIQPKDGLLDKICADCTFELDNAIHFKQKCEVSNRILLSSFRLSVGLNKNEVTEGSLKFSAALTEQEKRQVAEASFCNVGLKESKEAKQEMEVNYYGRNPTNDHATSLPVSYNSTVNFTHYEEQQEVNHEAGPPKRIRIIDLKLICHDCGQSFRTKCKLGVHWKKVHQPKTLICNVCKMQFKSYKTLQSHRKRKLQSCTTAGKIRIEGEGRSRRFYCKDCDYATHRIRDMTNHLNIHTGDRPWVCKLCPKTFTQQSVLQSHQENFHKNYLAESTCHICGKHCKGRSAIYRHTVMHQKSTYECDICGIILTRRNSLLLHLKRHSDKSYFCEKCPSRFYTNYELHSHKVRVHDKTVKVVRKRYHCDLCAYNTTHNNIMKKHRAKHNDRNIACEKCGKFFESEEKLNLHKKQHFERYYECTQCNNTYHTKEQLRIHLKRRHKITKVSNISSQNCNNPDLVNEDMKHENYFDITTKRLLAMHRVEGSTPTM